MRPLPTKPLSSWAATCGAHHSGHNPPSKGLEPGSEAPHDWLGVRGHIRAEGLARTQTLSWPGPGPSRRVAAGTWLSGTRREGPGSAFQMRAMGAGLRCPASRGSVGEGSWHGWSWRQKVPTAGCSEPESPRPWRRSCGCGCSHPWGGGHRGPCGVMVPTPSPAIAGPCPVLAGGRQLALPTARVAVPGAGKRGAACRGPAATAGAGAGRGAWAIARQPSL